MKVYSIKWKRLKKLFWSTEKNVIAHRLDKDQDKLVMYFPDGGLKEVQDWRSCQIKLATDWVLYTKSNMEKEAGQAVKLNVDAPPQ
jgi:hypothetical protein